MKKCEPCKADDTDSAIAAKALRTAAESAEARVWLQENMRHIRRATRSLFLAGVLTVQAVVIILAAITLLDDAFALAALSAALVVEAFAVAGLSLYIVRLSKVFAASKTHSRERRRTMRATAPPPTPIQLDQRTPCSGPTD